MSTDSSEIKLIHIRAPEPSTHPDPRMSWTLRFLLERKKLMTESSWQSEDQQNPIVVGGGVLPIEKITVMPYWNPVESTDE